MVLLAIVLYLFTDLFFSPPQGVASQPKAGDWAMFGRDLAHTGAAETPGPRPRGSVKWTFATGGAIYSSPAVVEQAWSTSARRTTAFYALDAATGSIRVAVPGRRATCNPRRRWSAAWSTSAPTTAGCPGAGRPLRRRAVVVPGHRIRDHLVAGGGGRAGSTSAPPTEAAPGPGRRHRTSARWSATLGGAIHSSPAVANGLVYVGAQGEFFYFVHAGDGRIRTWFRTRRDVSASPAVDGTTVYVTTTAGRLHVDGRHPARAADWSTACAVCFCA